MTNDGVGTTDNVRVGGSSLIGNLGDVASEVVSIVGDVLDPAVGEVDRVGARDGASSIVGLGLGEVSAGVVVSHGVLVVVGRGLGQVVSVASGTVSHDSVSHHGVGDHRVSHGVGHDSVSHYRMGHDSVTNELGTGGGDHQQGGETDKGLHDVV